MHANVKMKIWINSKMVYSLLRMKCLLSNCRGDTKTNQCFTVPDSTPKERQVANSRSRNET